MTQPERREWLIKALLNEPDSPDEYKKIELPPQNDEEAQKDFLRSLMNVRPPRPVSDEFLKIQDEYLTPQIPPCSAALLRSTRASTTASTLSQEFSFASHATRLCKNRARLKKLEVQKSLTPSICLQNTFCTRSVR